MIAGPASESDRTPSTTDSATLRPPARGGVLVALFVLATLVAIAGGVVYFRGEAAEVYADAAKQIELISRLKHRQLESWRMERLGDAEVLLSRNSQSAALVSLLDGGADAQMAASVREWLSSYLYAYHQYDRAFLIAPDGAVRLTEPDTSEPPAAALLQSAARAMRSREVELLDFYRDERDGRPHLGIVAPVLRGDVAIGAMVLRIDPVSELYTILEIEQDNSRTGETELVRRDGEDVLFLNPLRFSRDSALTLRASASDTHRLAAMAASGANGLVRGIDYRDAPVLGFIAPIADSSWILVTRIDVAELDATLRSHLWLVTTGVLLVIVSSGATLGLWRHDQRMRTVAKQAELAFKLKDSEEHLRLAMASARQGLWDLSLDTGITTTSPEYAVMLGHEPDDFEESAAAWNARVHPDDFERCQAVFRDYLEGRRPDYVVEFRQRTKSDGWTWIHSTGRIIEWTSDGRPTRLLGIHTDITPRKEAELSAARLSTLYLTLSRCNQAIVRSSSAEALFDEVCRAAVDSGGFAMAWVGIVDQAAGTIQRAAAYGAQLEYLDGIQLNLQANTAAGQGPFGLAVRNRAPVWFDDVEAVAVESPLMDWIRRFGWAGMAAVPLMRGGEAIGALGIYSTTKGRFDDESRQLLTEMGANISFALEAFEREARREEAEAQLRQSEQRYRALFSESSVPMLVIDPSRSLIVDANGAASSFYGWPVAELCGQPLSQIASLPPDELHAALDLTVAASRGHFTTRHQTRDGDVRDVEVFSAVITMENQQRVVAIVTDITARLQAERKAEQLSRMYLTLSRCNEAIVRSESAEDLFPQICAAAVDAGGFDLAWIGLVDPVSLDVRSVAANGRALDYIDGLRVSAHPDSPYAAGPTGLAIRERRPVWMNDIPNDSRTTPWRERVREYGWVAAVSIPLLREGEAVGALTIYSKTDQGFDEDTRGLLVEMAADLSFALDVLARDARREQAEQRLRQSEARYRTLFAESGVPMLLIESSTGRIVDANLAAAEFYGHDVAALRRMDVRQVDTLPEADLESRMAPLIGGQRMRFTAEHRLASGERRDVEVFTASVSVDDQARTLAIISDVTARNQAEAALIEKEFQLTEAQRLAHIGNWTRHPDGTGYWSDEMFRLYGLPVGATTPGPTDMDHCIHPEDLELVKRTQQAHLRGESVAELTFRILHPDTSVRYLVERGERRTSPDGRSYAAGTLQDVTDRTNAELALLQSEERLRLAQRAARQGLWDLDLVSGTAMVSPPDATAPGFADGIASLTLTQFGEMFHPEDRDRVGAAFRAYATGTARSFDEEFRLVLPDGQVRWAQSTGGIVERDSEGRTRRVVGVVTDITERHAFLAALRLRDRAIESSQNAVAIADLEGRITYVNRAFLDTWEMTSPAEAIGRNANAFSESPDQTAAIMRNMTAEQAPWSGELRIVTAQGRLRDMLTSAAFVTDEHERPIGLVAAFVDITDRKLTEQAMAASLREKEALLKEVHHRVKNNLQVISSLLRLELGRTAEPGVRLVLGEMQNRIVSMALLHETLYRSDDLSRVDLSTYLNRLVQQLFRSSAPPSGRVALQVTVAPAFVDMEQAVPCGLLVTELVSNSLKHAFPDNRSGEIRVTLSPVDDGPALRLVVADTGVGLPVDFDARRAQSLGLVLVSDLARQLRGTLSIDAGPGATFTLVFTPRGGHHLPEPSWDSR